MGGVLGAALVMVTIGSMLTAVRFADLAERQGNSATAVRAVRLESDRLAIAESLSLGEAETA